ncbi:MAG TPA: protein-methionine-sulfoxide reductase catalytic subunit MsrP [Terriglobia bacterium]|nr:protein-methionine-sulfoxide reductase catalytic subunit MsrP [Terriglobia bacterium]
MLIQHAADILSSEITSETVYRNRREFMKAASLLVIPAVAPQTKPGPYDTNEKVTPYEAITTYNNYYEFGSDKSDPAKNSMNFKSRPWTVSVEGLRMDEATHPLTLIATGIYGKPLPNQNGAPWRLVVPWKYGFKGIKAIVSIRFVEKQPVSSWMEQWPQAYGFYANVNPSVDHPRWSQSREQRLGESRNILSGGAPRRTLMFNGYADQVAQMYAGTDLTKNY